MSPTTQAPTIFWFRRDLRLSDNPALVEAATLSAQGVLGLFIIDPSLLATSGSTRAGFLLSTLRSLSASMNEQLVVRTGDPVEVLSALAASTGARVVVATGDYAPAGMARDQRVRGALAALGVELRLVDSPYVVVPGTVRTKAGTPSRVFTPFFRHWLTEPQPPPVPVPEGLRWLSAESSDLAEILPLAATKRPSYFGDLPDGPAPLEIPAGEVAAHSLVAGFASRVAAYDDARNLPGVTGTSRLSPHLRFGSIHPRQVLATLSGATKGHEVFTSEIAWREFYADVLFHNPDSTHVNIQRSLDGLRVDRDAAAVARFQTWARGETGFPLVDAGMRQLLEEGWMHNRVRMVTASFLVKHLHLDWRWGAHWFMWRLVDGDVASNQQGWQWTAGTGTDASPYYRVFNPTLQAERFDPGGDYVRRYVSELASVPAPACLQPGGGSSSESLFAYARPMIDLSNERREALDRLAELRGPGG